MQPVTVATKKLNGPVKRRHGFSPMEHSDFMSFCNQPGHDLTADKARRSDREDSHQLTAVTSSPVEVDAPQYTTLH